MVTALVLVTVAVVPPFRRAAALGAAKVVLFLASPLAPDISGFGALPATSRILAADGSVLVELDTPAGGKREPVQLDALPRHVWRSVLAAEDENFFSHSGVDPEAVFRALLRNAQGRTQGGSTVTQQLAKINYTGGERTVLRKFREVLYASELEKRFSKEELLERYLNQVYFGDRAYGIAAASQQYFGVPPSQLTVAQAALLAGKIKSPEELDPRAQPGPTKARRDAVLENMAESGWLSPAQLREALAAPVEVQPSQAPASTRAPHFVDFVIEEAKRLPAFGGTPEGRAHQLFTGGYTVETTLDPRAFDAAETAVRAQLGAPTDPATSVVSVQPGDGAIRVMVSGLDPARKFNLAEHRGDGRQPGSAFKPFVYLTALRDGIDPRSAIDARSPKQLEYRGERYTVRNYEGDSAGAATIDDALAHSINTVFAELILEVQPPNVVKTAQAAGILHPDRPLDDDRYRPAIALGGLRHGVTPLEMAAAYATFAAKGVHARPYAIAKVSDREGRVVHAARPQITNAFDPKEVGVLNAALMGVMERGTGTGARIGRPAAGKTGTTQNYGDAWFVGFVPQLSTAVWVGDPDRIEPMTSVRGRRVSGGSFPASIWRQTMTAALAGVPVEPIHTASPDSLGLRPLGTTTTSTSSTTSSTTTTLLVEPVPGAPATTASPSPGQGTTNTTRRPATTTTTRPPATTTTTRAQGGGPQSEPDADSAPGGDP